jgi:Ger(x)C family germination protein
LKKLKSLKNILILLIILPILTATAGCRDYSPFVRLEQRIMVQLVGIDWDEGVYTVSVQYSMGKTSDGGRTENDLATVTGSGRNMYSAIKQARSAAGKEFFFTHNQVLILGENVLKNGPITAIEEYLVYCDDHAATYVAGVFGKAEDIISLTYKDEFSDKNKIMLILENAANMGIYPIYMIFETLMAAYSESGSCFIPMLHVQAAGSNQRHSENQDGEGQQNQQDNENDDSEDMTGDESGGDPKAIPLGGVLIVDDKIAEYIEPKMCEGISLLSNSSNISSVDFVCDDVKISLELFPVKTKIYPKYKDGQLVYRVELTAVADSVFNHVLDIIGDYDYDRAVHDAVLNMLDECAQKITSLGGDLFFLEDTLKHHNFKAWLKVEDEWRETLGNVRFDFSVDITIHC